MRIEIVGLPGSGKTYLSRIKSNNFDIEFIRAGRSLKKYFFCLLFIFHNPFLFFEFLFLLIKENKKDPFLFKYKLYLFSNALSREGQALRREEYIIDEGMFHFAFAFYERQINDKDLRLFLKFYKRIKKRKILLLEVQEKTRRKRLEERQRVPRLALGGHYANKANFYFLLNKKVIYNFFLKNMDAEIFFNN
jgi:hypothetical protein